MRSNVALIASLALVALLAGCNETRSNVSDGSDGNLQSADFEALSKAVLTGFFDPDSAQFASLHYLHKATGDDRSRICGWVNAKNRLGGYVGYQPFFYDVAEKKAFFLPAEIADQPQAQDTFAQLVDAMGCKAPLGARSPA